MPKADTENESCRDDAKRHGATQAARRKAQGARLDIKVLVELDLLLIILQGVAVNSLDRSSLTDSVTDVTGHVLQRKHRSLRLALVRKRHRNPTTNPSQRLIRRKLSWLADVIRRP